MDKNPFLHRLIKEKKEDVVHSSAYAQAQNAGIGASSTQSFEKRREIDQNRTVVRGYGDSKIVSEAPSNAPRAKTYDPAAGQGEKHSSPRGSYRELVEKRAEFNSGASRVGGGAANVAGEAKTSSTTGNRFQALPDRGPNTPPARRNPGIMR